MLLCRYIKYQYKCKYLYKILFKYHSITILNININKNIYIKYYLNITLLLYQILI